MKCGHSAEEHAAYIHDRLGVESWDVKFAVLTTMLEYQDDSHAIREKIEQGQEQEAGTAR